MRDRNYRRFQQERTIKNRAKNGHHYLRKDSSEVWGLFFDNVKQGLRHTWLRTTGRNCSCSICKRPRYSKKDRIYKIDT